MRRIFCFAVMTIALISNSVNGELVIMPTGDSITSGYHGTNPGSYRDVLQSRLITEGIGYDFVGQYSLGFNDNNHQSVAGASIAYMTMNYAEAFARYRPDFALVLAGTNNHFSPPDLAAFVVLYQDLVDMIQTNSPQTQIIFATVPKFGYGGPQGVNYWSNAFVDHRNSVTFPNMNAAIYRVAARSTNVHVVDFFSAIDISTDMTADGIHPNLFGHQKLARLFGDKLVELNNFNGVPEPSTAWIGMLILSCLLNRRPHRQMRQAV